jgi:ABC-type uncharacterized transport system YnjBCD substrate-binding protein
VHHWWKHYRVTYKYSIKQRANIANFQITWGGRKGKEEETKVHGMPVEGPNYNYLSKKNVMEGIIVN